MAISSLPWQATTALIALVSLLVFLPLSWVRATLPTHGASLVLTLLAPTFLVGGLLVFLPLYYSIYQEHYHLQNELGGFLVVLVPAVTALGAWLLGIVDVLRRRAWGWLAPVALVPFLGTLAYGAAAGRRTSPDDQSDGMGLGSLLLAGALLALLTVLLALIVVLAGLDPSYDSTPELFALFGGGVAVAVGAAGGFALLRGRRASAAAVLLITTALGVQLFVGTSFPVQDVRAPGWAPSVVLRVVGLPATEPAGLWVTLGLVATLAALELACAPHVAHRGRR